MFASAADEPVTAAVPKRQKRREEPSLDARDVPQVTDVGLAEIAAECHALERLDINGCPLVTDKGLIASGGARNLRLGMPSFKANTQYNRR